MYVYNYMFIQFGPVLGSAARPSYSRVSIRARHPCAGATLLSSVLCAVPMSTDDPRRESNDEPQYCKQTESGFQRVWLKQTLDLKGWNS